MFLTYRCQCVDDDTTAIAPTTRFVVATVGVDVGVDVET